MAGKRQEKFRYIVQSALPIIMNKYLSIIPSDKLNIKMAFDVLGKTLSVTEEELNEGNTPMSDRAQDFIEYQLFLTDKCPYWYKGSKINREI